jgi:pimeloyl-ACP methyl ester carboxylesterase
MRRFALACLTLIASLALIVFCVWLAGRHRVLPAELAKTSSFQLAQDHGRFVAIQGLNIFAITMGAGRDVLLIHGDPASTWSWRKVMEPLSAQFRVHAIDLPGYGFSDKPDGATYDDSFMVRYVMGYLDEEGIKSAVLVGNSVGGEIASQAAIEHPERISALVLIDATGIPPEPGHEITDSAPPLIARMSVWPLVGPVVRSMPFRSVVRDGLRQAVYDPTEITERDVDAWYAPLRTQGGANAYLSRMMLTISQSRREQIKTIKAPTLVITGENDQVVSPWVAERYHYLIAGSGLVVIKDTGHMAQEERPERTIAEIKSFLQAHP